jgi:hypothetical protein
MGYAYYLLEIFHPTSFKASENVGDDIGHFYYYSFETLTTVGYGDILAITNPAQALSILEAIIVQLYLAIMISSRWVYTLRNPGLAKISSRKKKGTFNVPLLTVVNLTL